MATTTSPDHGAPPAKPVRYAEQAPGTALADVVLSYWTFETRADAEPFVHHIWPDGCISISVGARSAGDPPFAGIAGPTAEARRFPVGGGACYHGVRFWPDVGGAALGAAAESLRDRMLPAAEVVGAAAAGALLRTVTAAADRDARARAFDEWIGEHLPPIPSPDPEVRRAVRAIVASHGERPIAAIAADVGLGARQLQRRFGRAVGLTPKEYARVRRARSALAALLRGDGNWAALAAELGYADQPHLIHELGDLTGFTPVALRERLAIIDHADVVP
ncbi:MAG TPA: AraC family transcriptional regulator [Gemmatimonadaceae bacterium]